LFIGHNLGYLIKKAKNPAFLEPGMNANYSLHTYFLVFNFKPMLGIVVDLF
jgi:hypothetical protein